MSRGRQSGGIDLDFLWKIFVVLALAAVVIPNVLHARQRVLQKRTIAELQAAARSIDEFWQKHQRYPDPRSVPARVDGWGGPIRYECWSDRSALCDSYAVASAGRDGAFERESLRAYRHRSGEARTSFDTDVVLIGGRFVQLPEASAFRTQWWTFPLLAIVALVMAFPLLLGTIAFVVERFEKRGGRSSAELHRAATGHRTTLRGEVLEIALVGEQHVDAAGVLEKEIPRHHATAVIINLLDYDPTLLPALLGDLTRGAAVARGMKIRILAKGGLAERLDDVLPATGLDAVFGPRTYPDLESALGEE